MTTMAALADWLDRYEQAWRNNDADQVGALFTDDAVYRWHPWEESPESAEGREAIVDAWMEQLDEPDDWTLECEPVAVNGEVGVARCVTRYRATARGPERVYHNIWILSLDDDGRCSDYTEYYMKEPTEETA
jgi:ketosteroid isomerase-like protein